MADQLTPKARRPSIRERLSTRLQSLRTPAAAKERQGSGQEDGSAGTATHAHPAGLASPAVMSPRSREGTCMEQGAMVLCAPGWDHTLLLRVSA
jgi:hypothetical protein